MSAIAMNLVQFQPGLSMVEFTQYGNETKCYRALYRARWPRLPLPGLQRAPALSVSPRPAGLLPAPRLPAQTTLLSGAIFQATKLPLHTCDVPPL
ncbi:hypothetical protein HDE76_003238 [Rhodanobacter sp. ANJX3]|nr:hypothetical protein [Rhodanobacter sp. ANJX3]